MEANGFAIELCLEMKHKASVAVLPSLVEPTTSLRSCRESLGGCDVLQRQLERQIILPLGLGQVYWS